MDLALNNLQRLICHKTQTTKQSNQKVKGASGMNSCVNIYFVMMYV